MTSGPGSARRVSLLTIILAATLMEGCCNCPPPPPPSSPPVRTIPDATVPRPDREEPNHDPRIAPLYAETQDGRRIRIVRPGSTVRVASRVKDADADVVRYAWRVVSGAGSVDDERAPSVLWRVGANPGQQELRLTVHDGRGGTDEASLRISGDTVVVFSGRVLGTDGLPLDSASVDVNGDRGTTDGNGQFRVEVSDTEADRFVVNVRKPGYGLLSRVYENGSSEAAWTMRPASIHVVDPTQPIVVQDVLAPSQCVGTVSQRVDWALYPKQRIARVFDTDGQPWQGPFPQEVLDILALLDQTMPCGPGITVSIPANALVDDDGVPPAGMVEIALTTIELLSPDAMPGDFTVQDSTGASGYMQSYGAGTIEITADGRGYQLRPEMTAQITIPVDPVQRLVEAELPRGIPLLRYDGATGDWRPDGTAFLQAGRNAYVGSVSHFSEFNTDLIKTDQSCVRVDSGAITGDYDLEVTIPMPNAAPVVRNYVVGQASETLHAVYNLPQATWVVLVPFQGSVPLGTFVVNTGLTQIPSTPNRPSYPYEECQSEIALFDAGGDIEIVADGTGHDIAILPVVSAILVNVAGAPEDIYPVGDDNPRGQSDTVCFPAVGPPTVYPCLYVYGLFDTGAEIVAINQIHAADLGIGGLAPTDALLDVAVRLHGIQEVDPSSLLGQIFAPGQPFGADVQVGPLRVGVRNVNATLIGAPVVNEVVALMNFGSTHTRGPYQGNQFQDGPEFTFFAPGSPGIPVPELTLPLQRFFMPGTSSAAKGELYLLRDVTFRNTVGANNNELNDDQTVPTPYNFSFDTGTQVTIVNNRIAQALGIVDATLAPQVPALFSCLSGTNNGFRVDEVEMQGTGGTYRITDASVCWSDADIITRLSDGTLVDAVIGANFFDQFPLLFDGPGNTLGIGVAGFPPG